jgi:phage terminase large subunit-like protein
MGQGFISMSAPMKELERMAKGHQMLHGDNPVLNWMADNVVASLDAAGNIKPDKMKSKEKIDGITALVMAVARTMAKPAEPESVYETRGVRRLGMPAVAP